MGQSVLTDPQQGHLRFNAGKLGERRRPDMNRFTAIEHQPKILQAYPMRHRLSAKARHRAAYCFRDLIPEID